MHARLAATTLQTNLQRGLEQHGVAGARAAGGPTRRSRDFAPAADSARTAGQRLCGTVPPHKPVRAHCNQRAGTLNAASDVY